MMSPALTTPGSPSVAPRPLEHAPGGGALAVVKPAPPPVPAKPLSRAEQITRYILDYNGGECFYVTPVAVTAGTAKIEAYGALVGPFTEFDDAFKRAVGFEAEIGLRQVAPEQCPALTFVARLKARAGAVRLKIPEGNLKGGSSLNGTVEGHGNSQVLLLLVSATGAVENMSAHLKSARGGETFSLRLPRPAPGPPQPSVLMAITGAPPLDVLKRGQAVPADQLFPQLLAEATSAQLPLAAELRYFKVER
jgi:serine/threonine-protein kinase